MVDRGIFQGEMVRLAAIDPSADAGTFSNWYHSSEFQKLLDSRPARPLSERFFEQDLESSVKISNTKFLFTVRAVAGDDLIGWVELDDIEWPHATGWVGIGIGNPAYWGKGYGTDAMKVLIRFAFLEVGLYRLSLNVFEYNERALHVYEKSGFKVEGRVKNYLNRDGRRWDVIYMGLLRSEWQRT